MSGFNNNFNQRQWLPPPRGFLGPEEDSGAQGGAFSSYSSRVVRQVIYRSPLNDVFHAGRSLSEPLALTEGRVMVGSLSGFPSFLLPILDGVMVRDTISTPIHSTPTSRLELIRHEGDHPNLPLDEQHKALTKLRKEIYNPAPKRLTKRVSQYYKDGNSKSTMNDYKVQQEDDEDEKRCAICLDDFEVKQVVAMTPCNHMFHEDCIMPWVKIHGPCPVCRSPVSDQM